MSFVRPNENFEMLCENSFEYQLFLIFYIFPVFHLSFLILVRIWKSSWKNLHSSGDSLLLLKIHSYLETTCILTWFVYIATTQQDTIVMVVSSHGSSHMLLWLPRFLFKNTRRYNLKLLPSKFHIYLELFFTIFPSKQTLFFL